MKALVKIVLAILLLNGFEVTSQEKEIKLSLGGYIKNLHEWSFVDKLEQSQWTALLHNRLNFKYIPSDAVTIRIELRNRIFYGDGVSAIPGFSDIITTDNGWMDLSWNLVNEGHVLANTTIDRALLNYSKGNWDIAIGRQRVNWGVNLVWNPNDIFNTYNFLDFDYEERPGSDALRVQYFLGDFNKIELAAKKGRGKDDHIIATMYKFNKWSYDIQLITGIYEKDWIIGAGWAGNLKNAGFKGEVSYFIPYGNTNVSDDVLSASASIDYGFKKGLYINGSLLYNSAAGGFIGGFENLILSNVTAKNLMPFEYGGFLQLSKEFSPVFSASMSTIYSPTNQSTIVIPSFNYSLAPNWEFNFTGQSFFEFEAYKSLGHSFFARLRWSF